MALDLLTLLLACRPAPTTSVPVALPHGRIGALEPVAALWLEGDRRFGGWSGAAIERSEGGHVLWAVGDTGSWLRLRLEADAEGRLVGVEELGRGALVDAAGAALSGKTDADAESLVRTPGGWIVGFERHHRLLAYDAALGAEVAGPAEEVPLPPGFAAPENGGLEAIGRTEGELVLLVEGDEGATGPHPGWIGQPGRWTPIALARTGDLRPVELAPMGPDLLLVERAWTEAAGSTIRLSRLPATALRAGGVVAPIELGVLRGPELPIDNFEAAAADGDTIWLLSDDNFSSSQRTLLLQLRWTPPDPALRGARLERYALDGRDQGELARSCATACPRDDQGQAVRGLTSWSLRWTWDPERTVGPDGVERCRLVNVRAHVEVVVKLPRWAPPRDADPDLVASFPAYLDALALHEQGHVDLVHQAAREGEGRLPEVPCAESHDHPRRWLDELRVRQAALDLETKSGHLQGAELR